MVLDPDDPKTNPWTVMDTLKAIEAEESLKNDKIKLHADRKAMAASLDSQMSVFTVREKQVMWNVMICFLGNKTNSKPPPPSLPPPPPPRSKSVS